MPHPHKFGHRLQAATVVNSVCGQDLLHQRPLIEDEAVMVERHSQFQTHCAPGPRLNRNIERFPRGHIA